MSRVEEFKETIELVNNNFETMSTKGAFDNNYLLMLEEIAESLAVIADKLSEQPEEEEDENERRGCYTCHYWETPPQDWPCKVCSDDLNMHRPRTNGKEPEGEGGPKSGDH